VLGRKNGEARNLIPQTVAGYKMADQERNDAIRAELRVTDIDTTTKTNQKNWLENVEGMSENRIQGLLCQYKPRRVEGTRDIQQNNEKKYVFDFLF
jgi:hypothetical protein